MVDIEELLRQLVESEGSDLHLKVGAPPTIRVDGSLRRLSYDRLSGDDTARIAGFIMPPDRRANLEGLQEADFAYSLAGVGRFRVNVFHQRGSISLVMRRVRVGGPSFEDQGALPVLRSLVGQPRGLVLVTGPTGFGKTTSMA